MRCIYIYIHTLYIYTVRRVQISGFIVELHFNPHLLMVCRHFFSSSYKTQRYPNPRRQRQNSQKCDF